MEDGKIFFAKKDKVCFIKMIGPVRCTNISGFDAFVEQLIRDESIEDTLIDLCELTYIDSTNLGLIAKIADSMIKKFNRKPKIVSTDKNISFLIENMGFDKVFIIIKKPKNFIGELQSIPGIEQDEREKARMILEAHKTLMTINEHNRDLFKDVVEILGNQLDSSSE